MVVALGGHSLLPKGERPTIAREFQHTRKSVRIIPPLLEKGWDVVLTHGNGPQVGNILIQSEAASGKAYTVPLCVAVAESQGEIGYILQQAMCNEFSRCGIQRSVVTVLTQVLVDDRDTAFQEPPKPIGPFYTEAQARRLQRSGIDLVEVDRYGWRRVVPSPRPLEIIEAETVRRLIDEGVVVIAAGGGGIPVTRRGRRLRGVDAVIDKDLASSCLAKALQADQLVMLTDVPRVALGYGTPDQRDLSEMTTSEAQRWLEDGQFPPGSMGPKIEAAIDFAQHLGKPAIITTPEALESAQEGLDGTRILP